MGAAFRQGNDLFSGLWIVCPVSYTHLDVYKRQGLVDDWEERRAVERAVWSAPGVHSIEDNIRIN